MFSCSNGFSFFISLSARRLTQVSNCCLLTARFNWQWARGRTTACSSLNQKNLVRRMGHEEIIRDRLAGLNVFDPLSTEYDVELASNGLLIDQ